MESITKLILKFIFYMKKISQRQQGLQPTPLYKISLMKILSSCEDKKKLFSCRLRTGSDRINARISSAAGTFSLTLISFAVGQSFEIVESLWMTRHTSETAKSITLKVTLYGVQKHVF